MENVGPIFDAGYLSPSSFKNLNEALDEVIKRLRPMLIPLAEAKCFAEIVMPSSIGNYYGDIYETQVEWAKDSSMNHLDKDGVPPQWEEHIKPFLHKDVPIKFPDNLPKLIKAKL